MTSSNANEWTRLLGGSKHDFGNAITTGSDGSFYIVGTTEGDLNGQTNSGSSDAFVSKFNPDGTKEWTKLLGGSKNDFGNVITTGSDGSIYIVGTTEGDLNGQTNSGSSDAFVSKFNPDGTKVWIRLLGGSKHDFGNAITTGSDGSIYVAGKTFGDLDGQTNNRVRDYISKYHPDGTKLWTKISNHSGNGDLVHIRINDDGSIFALSSEESLLPCLGDWSCPNTIQSNNWFSKYDHNFNHEWSIYFKNNIKEEWRIDEWRIPSFAGAFTVSNDGKIYVVSSEFNDAFICKVNSDGSINWKEQLGSSISNYGSSINISDDGSIYIAGVTFGDLDGQTNSGGTDAFISKFKSDGTKDWTRLIGSSKNDYGISITSNSDGLIYIVGTTEGDLNGQTNSGSSDAFIKKITNSYIPTDITLSKSSFNEDIDFGSHVATLSSSDKDLSDKHAYELVRGEGDVDNIFFTIEGNNLKNKFYPYYETKSSYNIRLKTIDKGGLSYEKKLTLKVNDIDEGNIGLGISKSSFNENIGLRSVIAELFITDQTSSNSYNFFLVQGEGDSDNDSFIIDGNKLKVIASPDYETKYLHNIRIRATENISGNSFDRAFTLNVNDINDAPSLISIGNFERYSKPPEFSWDPISIESEMWHRAKITSFDEDFDDQHSYALVSGEGDDHNKNFHVNSYFDKNSEETIHYIDFDPTLFFLGLNTHSLSSVDIYPGDNINPVEDINPDDFIMPWLNPEFKKSSYQFRLKSTDLGGLSYEQSFIWDVDSNTVQKNDPITGSSFTLDVDGNENVSALGDGLMIIRKLFGSAFDGDALTNKAISDNATRTTDEIHEYIQSGIDSLALDVDKNGTVTALGDGLMIIRHLFGSAFSGVALIDKAISSDSPYYGEDNASQMVADNIDSLLVL